MLKEIKDNVVIQIEITNACNLSCTNCSRLVGHHKKPFFMTLDEVRQAIISLNGFEGRIGLMGGEPTMHPQFEKICKIYQELIPNKRKRELWTDGFKWSEYSKIIKETFDEDLVHYNDHSNPEEGWHQPILISIDEVIEDKEKMWRLINNCWVQRRWSASVTPKGAFFCEVAAAIDHAFNGPGGWSLDSEWYNKTEEDYRAQQEFCCTKCSAAIPLGEIPNNHLSSDAVSQGNQFLLNEFGSPKVKSNRTHVPDIDSMLGYLNSKELEEGERGYWKSHSDWRPSEFRTKVWHGPGEGHLTPKEVMMLQRKNHGKNTANLAKKGHIAEIRSRTLYFTSSVLAALKDEVKQDLFDLVASELVGHEFDEENSLIEYLNTSLERNLSPREIDLMIKFASDPAFRD